MMDQPSSRSYVGGGSGMNKVPQYHFSGSGQSFQHPIYCNSATTVKGYGGGGGGGQHHHPHHHPQQQPYFQQQRSHQEQQQHQQQHAVQNRIHHDGVFPVASSNSGSGSGGGSYLQQHSSPHPLPPWPPFSHSDAGQQQQQQASSATFPMHQNNTAPSNYPQSSSHSQQHHYSHNYDGQQQQQWHPQHHHRQTQSSTSPSSSSGKRQTFYDASGVSAAVVDHRRQPQQLRSTFDREQQYSQPPPTTTSTTSRPAKAEKKPSSLASPELPPTPAYSGSSETSPPYQPPSPYQVYGGSTPQQQHQHHAQQPQQPLSYDVAGLPPTPGSSVPSEHYPPTPYSSGAEHQMHSPNSEASSAEYSNKKWPPASAAAAAAAGAAGGYLEYSHQTAANTRGGGGACENNNEGGGEGEGEYCREEQQQHEEQQHQRQHEFPLMHDLIGMANDDDDDEEGRGVDSGRGGEHHGNRQCHSSSSSPSSTSSSSSSTSDNGSRECGAGSGGSSAQDNSINSVGGESEGQQSVRSATATAPSAAAAAAAAAAEREGGRRRRAGTGRQRKADCGGDSDLLPLYRRLAEEATKGEEEGREGEDGGRAGGGEKVASGRGGRRGLKSGLSAERVGDDGDAPSRKRIRVESRRLSHGEALELDSAMEEAVRQMKGALGEGEAGKIIKRREDIVPNDDDDERAPAAKMVRLEFHADEVAGRRRSRNERDTGYANSAVGGGGGEAGAAAAAAVAAAEGGDDSDDCGGVETDDDDSEVGAGAEENDGDDDEEEEEEEDEGEIEMSGKTRCISSSFEVSLDDRGEVERQVGGEIRSLMERQIRLYDEAGDKRRGTTIRLRFEIDIKTAVVVEGQRSRRRSHQRKFRPGRRGGELGRCHRVPQRNQQQTTATTSKMLELERSQSEGGAASLHLIQPATAAATPLSKQRSCVPSNEPDCCKVELSEAPSGHNTAPPTPKAPRTPPPSAPAAVDRVIRAAGAAPGREGGGRGGRDGDGFTFICLSCPETFPISDLDAVTDHIATGFYKADGRCSAALDFLAQRVKLTVNDAARTVSANTLLSCKDCGGAEFDVNKRGEDVIGDIHRHLTTECRGGGAAAMKKQKKKGKHLGGNLCPFCDRRISASAGGDMSAHLADRRFRRAHYERLRAMLTCGCKSLLLAAAAAANDDDLRCKLCSKPNRRPHPALPGWLSKSACDKCLRSTVAKIERGGRAKERVVVVLCAFCKQGKFGYDGGKGCSSVCVNCFDLLDSFRRQLPAPMMSNDGGGAAAECRNYVYGILNELVNRLPKARIGNATDNDCAGSPKKQVAIVPPEPRLIAECCGGREGGGGGERQRHLKNNKGEERV